MQWTQDDDKRLVEPYRPVADLIESRVEKHPVLQKSLSEGRMVSFSVRDNQFTTTVQGKGQVGHAISMIDIPDLEVRVYQSEGDVLLDLTPESRDRLQAICGGKQTVAENIGVRGKRNSGSLLNMFPVGPQASKHMMTRQQLAEQFSVTENAIQNWCSVCCISPSLTEFNSVQVERLSLFKRLSDAGISARDIRAIFSGQF